MIDDPDEGRSTVDHTGVVDAMLRFGAGTDDGDAAMIASAFTEDAVVNFGACGRSIGLDFEPLAGAAVIVGFLAGTSRKQITSHVVTNARSSSTDAGSHIRVLVDATHVVRGEPSRRFRMMNWYDADLVPSYGSWLISRLVIDNVWFEGDPAVLFVR